MKLVLVEERAGQPYPEREFTSEVVKVGRDPIECHLVFDQTDWPMVSRRHAEFQLRDRRCLLVDTNSKFGTFVDSQRIAGPTELRVGARVQFGASGPVLRVVAIEQTPSSHPAAPKALPDRETERDVAVAPANVPRVIAPPPPAPRPEFKQPAAPKVDATPPASLELIESEGAPPRRIPLNKDVTRIGRDPDLDVVIDAAAAVVSRHHVEVRRVGGQWMVVDQGSFNGTLVNDFRITQPTPVYDRDRIQLGLGGPLLRLHDQSRPAPGSGELYPRSAGAAVVPPAGATGPFPQLREMAGSRPKTIVVPQGSGSLQPQMPGRGATQPQLLFQRAFDNGSALSVGRAPDSDIHLDGLTISNNHARVLLEAGTVFVEDVSSTNGVYVNGGRISGKTPLRENDIVQIGPFVLQVHPQRGVAVFDTRSKTRIDAIDITKVVRNRSGGGDIKLLDDVDLTILPNEFIGLLGPSGAGKSTLMDSLNGMRPASSGFVLINSLDLYRHLNSLKQSIGYVPQEDIIHRELTVYRTLYYVARLRLSSDVSTSEIDQIVNEVMDVTGLSERRDVPVAQLSGGQRKRVSIAVELITKPSVIFLDEPTSGLDPATEEKIMKLFRQIAESGRTVILTTHAMENVKLFDKIVVLMRGKLVFYGEPMEALTHVGANSFKDLYDRLEAPIGERIAQLGSQPANASREQSRAFKLRREQIAEEVAEEWRQRFQRTAIYQHNVVQPTVGLRPDLPSAAPAKQRRTVTDSVRQWGTLSRRYAEVLRRDKLNLLILLGQAPIIAFLTYLVVGENSPRDFAYFVLALVAVWFGTSVAAREIIRERAVYNRERMVNLGLLPYVGSKLFVLTVIVGIQCTMLYGSLKLFHYTDLMKFPGGALPQLSVMILTGVVGIALGLLVSAIVKTSEMATSLIPLILIPQILFSGLVGVPAGAAKVIGVAMPATWAFDEMKRLSDLDTLKQDGSDPSGKNHGRGLYKNVEEQNDRNIKDTTDKLTNYKKDADAQLKKYKDDMKDYQREAQTNPYAKQPPVPTLSPVPSPSPAVKFKDEELSDYIDFLHSWGNVFTDPAVLFVMFFGLLFATLITLRAQDIG
jgi:ABC-type multidrug transport system ATPase subunit/pSer/pThr/pTyr-binding forkhead associated (FHA) protein